MRRWYWVRHGPTHQNAFTGWRDVPADLSDHAALTRLNGALPGDARIVSSDLARAIATADAIQGARARLPHDPRLREFNFGAWEGKGFAEVDAEDTDLARGFLENPGDTAPPGGESWNALAKRVGGFVDQTNGDGQTSPIIAVAHFGVILTQLARALPGGAVEALGHVIEPLSITSLSFEGGVWQAGTINHLP